MITLFRDKNDTLSKDEMDNNLKTLNNNCSFTAMEKNNQLEKKALNTIYTNNDFAISLDLSWQNLTAGHDFVGIKINGVLKLLKCGYGTTYVYSFNDVIIPPNATYEVCCSNNSEFTSNTTTNLLKWEESNVL